MSSAEYLSADPCWPWKVRAPCSWHLPLLPSAQRTLTRRGQGMTPTWRSVSFQLCEPTRVLDSISVPVWLLIIHRLTSGLQSQLSSAHHVSSWPLISDKRLFETKRKDQLNALKNLVELNDINQQYKIIDIMLKGLFKVGCVYEIHTVTAAKWWAIQRNGSAFKTTPLFRISHLEFFLRIVRNSLCIALPCISCLWVSFYLFVFILYVCIFFFVSFRKFGEVLEDWKKPVLVTNMLKWVKYICKYRFVVCITLVCNGEHTEAKD